MATYGYLVEEMSDWVEKMGVGWEKDMVKKEVAYAKRNVGVRKCKAEAMSKVAEGESIWRTKRWR